MTTFNDHAPQAGTTQPDTASEVFDWLDTEVSAIDIIYRGSPTYVRDAEWMKDKVLDLIKLARKAFEPLPSAAANPKTACKTIYVKPLRTLVAVDERFADQIRDLLNAPPVQQSAAIAAGLREKVALEIWHRWADSGTLEWAEETHQAEYLLCADAILALVVAAPNASPEPDAVREALRELYIWWDRDGSVGSASEIFERHRAAVDTALARHDRGSEAR